MRTLNQDRAARRIEAQAIRPIRIEVTDDPFERFRAYDQNGLIALADSAKNLCSILKSNMILPSAPSQAKPRKVPGRRYYV